MAITYFKNLDLYCLFSPVGKRNYSQLDIFHIYLDTSTYDEIERDVKNSFEDQLGVVGGTMGLFTGFSILSGVEIIFYLAKLFVTRAWQKS